jgi:hypothetical protein
MVVVLLKVMVGVMVVVEDSESYCSNIEQVVHVVWGVVVILAVVRVVEGVWFVKKVSERGFVMVD